MGEDVLVLLSAANPVQERELPNATSESAQRLYERIVAEPPPVALPGPGAARGQPAREQPVRWRRPAVIAVVAAAVISIAAGVYVLTTRDVSKRANVACYEKADLSSKTIVVAADKGGPTRACERLWADGAFGRPQPPPPLTACVLESGVVGVFPAAAGASPCETLRLPKPAPERPPASAGSFLDFKEAVVGEFVSRRCIEADEASAIVLRELDRHGLSDWTVGTDGVPGGAGFSADRPCAALGFDEEHKHVILVPVPPRN